MHRTLFAHVRPECSPLCAVGTVRPVAFSSYTWTRVGISLPANGASVVPLLGNNQNVMSGSVHSTLIRSRLEFFGYVFAGGAGTGVELQWWQDVIFNVGVWWDDAAVVPANSPTPITNSTVSPDWVCNEQLRPHVDVYDLGSPSENVSWTYPGGVIDVASKRKAATSTAPSVWVAWEVFDPSGFINQTEGGLFYGLGLNCWLSCLFGNP